jgi:hypothetical protein
MKWWICGNEMEMKEYMDSEKPNNKCIELTCRFWKLDQHLVTASSVTKCIETFKTDRLFRPNFVTDYFVSNVIFCDGIFRQ